MAGEISGMNPMGGNIVVDPGALVPGVEIVAQRLDLRHLGVVTGTQLEGTVVDVTTVDQTGLPEYDTHLSVRTPDGAVRTNVTPAEIGVPPFGGMAGREHRGAQGVFERPARTYITSNAQG